MKTIYAAFACLFLAAMLMSSGCDSGNLLSEFPHDASLSFSATEAADLLTKAAPEAERAPEDMAAREITLTADDGQTLRLVMVEEPLYSPVPATKAKKVYTGNSSAPAGSAPYGLDDFAAWAYRLPSPAAQPASGVLYTQAPYSFPIKVGYDSSSGTPKFWRPAKDDGTFYEIPFSESATSSWLRWYAVAPYESPLVSAVTAADGQNPSLSWTVPGAVADQLDLLAAVSSSREEKASESAPIDLKFCHVLTGVRFKRDAGLDVQEIRLSGVYDRGDLDLTKVPADGDLSGFLNVDDSGHAQDLWSDRTKSTASPAYRMTAAEITWVSDTAGQDKNILMMIPQWTPQGAQISVTYGTGANAKTFTGDISGHRWLPGRIVTYRIDGRFSVTYGGVTTESFGTPVAGQTIILDDPSQTDLIFSVATNRGFTVEISDPSAASSSSSANAGSVHVTNPATVNVTQYSSAVSIHDPGIDPGLTVMKPFSISDTKKVYFSPGNLQYQALTGTWRFAPRQWDFVGSDTYGGTVYEGGVKSTNTITPEADRATYDGWIDLFGFGTTGINYRPWAAGKTEYQPWTISTATADYGPASGAGPLAGDSEWGVNPILHGSTVIPRGTYYTLLSGNTYGSQPQTDESRYMLLTRGGTNDYFRYLKARIWLDRRIFTVTIKAKNDPGYAVTYTVVQPGGPDIAGLIVFPDDFAADNPDLASMYRGFQNGYNAFYKSVPLWTEFQNAGCVFLPAAGLRSGASVNQAESGHYWGRSGNPIAYFHTTGQNFSGTASREQGCSVRLVRDAN